MTVSVRRGYALRVPADPAEKDSNRYITLRESAGQPDVSENNPESIVRELAPDGIPERLRGMGRSSGLA